MKKLLSIMAAVAFALTANVAMAAVSGTPHQFARTGSDAASAYGLCEVCHVPHAAQTGRRIWRAFQSITSGGAWDTSNVGQLCGQCHNGGAMGTAKNVNGALVSSQGAYAYNELNHNRVMTALTNAVPTGVGDALNGSNDKPYMGNANIECTSCHNPHDETLRPFLRPSPAATGRAGVAGFCADCHDRRYKDTILTNVTTNEHPVYVTYQDNANNGSTDIQPVANLDANLKVAVVGMADNTGPTWPLGGKFEGALTAAPTLGTDLIGCGTCHSVHAAPTTTDANARSLYLLAVDNTGTYAALCENCHGGRANVAKGAQWAPYSTVGAGSDHPIDLGPEDNGALVAAGYAGTTAIDRWFNDAPTTTKVERPGTNVWPQGSAGNIICTSCHSAHNSSSDRGRLTRDLFTPAFVGAKFCNACHQAPSPLGHHSNTNNYASSAITCDNCHGGSGAHNGFHFTFTDAQNQYSNLCARCHLYAQFDYNGTWPADKYEATGHGATAPSHTDPAWIPSPTGDHLPGLSEGVSHFLGSFTDAAANGILAKRNVWTYGKSKYGASRTAGAGWGNPTGPDDAGTTLICESCHSVLYNFGAATSFPCTQTSGYDNNLLLQNYVDDSFGGTAGSTGAGLCVGCHTQTATSAGTVPDANVEGSPNSNVPPNMHPMTAWSITRAQDAGESPTSLITEDGTRNTYATAFMTAAAGTAVKTANNLSVSYPDQNKMDCDSCHRPHRADNTGGGTYDTRSTGRADAPVILETSGPGTKEFDALCTQCHAY